MSASDFEGVISATTVFKQASGACVVRISWHVLCVTAGHKKMIRSVDIVF